MSIIKTRRNVVPGKRKRQTTATGDYFGLINDRYGLLATRQNYAMGGQWAYGILGPDLKNPGMLQTNTPSAKRPGFTSAWTGANKPDTIFLTNRYNGDAWIRGHLINGAWGGSGASWRNLTPLTKTANSNHETLERKMNTYLTNSHSYDYTSSVRSVNRYWYGIEYLVECSQNPFAHNSVDVPTNLYAYAPEFIRITWRAVRILKPTNLPTNVQPPAVINYIQNAVINPVGVIPFATPNMGNLRNNGVLPNGATYSGSPVYNSGINVVPYQNNGFDGRCEIHQTA